MYLLLLMSKEHKYSLNNYKSVESRYILFSLYKKVLCDIIIFLATNKYDVLPYRDLFVPFYNDESSDYILFDNDV